MVQLGRSMQVLKGQRVELRPIAADDAEALYNCWSHPEVAFWLGAPPLSSVAETRELIVRLLLMADQEESLRWSIVLPDGEVIGTCGFNNWQLEGAYRGELGCELQPDYSGRGYMREALTLLLEYGYRVMELNRVEVLCHPDNMRADTLFTSLGFRREGILREYRHTVSGFQDVQLYALLRSDMYIN